MAKKTDANHAEIRQQFRRKGATWIDTFQLRGFCDGVIGYRGLTALVEVKDGKGRLTEAQEKLQAEFTGLYAIVRTEEDVDTLLLKMTIMSDRIAAFPAD